MVNTDVTRGLIPPGSHVLCAVSGGADSMCLLHLLSQREDITLTAAHFNHRLRGEESDRDEAFVRGWCESHGIPFRSGAGDVAAQAKRFKMGIEETARALRYGFLSQLALELGCDLIATAHNAGDNAETVLLHLLRGTGLQGLTGIEPRRWKYVRPLLSVSREEIEAYLTQHNVPHVEDSTNADDTYARNRIRHQLIPLLEELAPGFVARMGKTTSLLRADNDHLNALAGQLLKEARPRGDDLVIPAALLAGAPGPVASRAVRLLLAEAAEGDWDCSAAHIEGVLSLCAGASPSARFSLPRGLTARREYDKLILTHEEPLAPLEVFPLKEGTNPVPGTGWTVLLKGRPWPGLVVRPRQTGDEITLPNGHRKALKKLFIDQKLPRQTRERIPIVADAGGVIAVAGFGSNPAHPCHRQVTIFRETEAMEHGDP